MPDWAWALAAASANAQDTVKIGIINPYSGQFADTAIQMDNAIKLYVKQHGDTVAGKKLEFIRKDAGGVAPDLAKRLAQELIVRDHVDITRRLRADAKRARRRRRFRGSQEVHGGHERGHRRSSPQNPRTSPAPRRPRRSSIRRSARGRPSTASRPPILWFPITDPASTPRAAFHTGFKEAGGEIVGSVRFPVANPDFSAFVQRAKDANPDAIYIWIPGGAQPAAVGKALAERGVDPAKIKVLGQDALTFESALKSMGDVGVGIITVSDYDFNHDSPLNHEFVKAYNDEFHRNPDIYSIGGYDGMHLIYEALKKTGGKADGDALIAAAKGMSWESPRGPITIDPDTRDIIQTVYIRRVEKIGDAALNVEFDKVETVKDPVKERMKK